MLRQVLAAQSNIYLAQYGMGAALVQQQQYAEAVPYLHKAIELQPDSAWAHYAMGVSLMKTGDFKTSAVHLEIAVGAIARIRWIAFSSGRGLRAPWTGPGRGARAKQGNAVKDELRPNSGLDLANGSAGFQQDARTQFTFAAGLLA